MPLACTIVGLLYIIVAVLVVVVFVFVCLFACLVFFGYATSPIRFSQGTYQKVTNDPH